MNQSPTPTRSELSESLLLALLENIIAAQFEREVSRS